MRLGVKASLLLSAGYVLLLAAFALGVDRWLRAFEEATTAETVRLLAREQAGILSERTYEALLVPDGASHRRLRERVEDVLLLSEIVKSVTVVDAQGHVVASDRWRVGETFPTPDAVFGASRELRADPLTDRAFFGGGDYAVSIPFPEGDRLVGYVRMDLHSGRVADLYRDVRQRLLVLALLGLSGVALLGLLLQVQMSRRAATLARVLEDAGTGPAPPVRGDEFAHALAAASRVRHELSEAREQRTRLHQGFDALAQVMKVGVVLVDKECRIDFANERALELFGAPDLDALRALWALTVPDVGALFADRGSAASGGSARGVDVEADGRALRLEVYRQGEPEGCQYLALVHDPRALDALETDVRLASQLDGLARTFRTAAHEIRSPLAALMINLDLLRDSLDDGEAAGDGAHRQRDAYVSVLSQELTRLNRSLSELLTQSLPAPDSQERLDLRALVEELGMLLAPQARRLAVELSIRLPPNDVVLVGYRDRLKQAFLNVAVNALEAMPQGGRMWIEMQECPDRVRVAVGDTGPGIPAELLARIYESDFTTKGGGSGIGLYVARTVVELHGGGIEAQSAPGEGTTVAIDLPLVPRHLRH
jgi:two-component system, NtrC family, sensor histidine kinase HydH